MGNNLEIDIIEFLKIILSNKKKIIRVIIIAGIVGAVISLLMKKEFEANCKLLPEIESSQSKGLGSLGGLAGLVGINASDLGSSGVSLSPDIYPIIVKSIPFKDQLLNKSFYFRKHNESYTGYKYFDEIYSPSILDYIIKLPNHVRKFFKSRKIGDSKQNNADSNVWSISYRQKVVFVSAEPLSHRQYC